MNDNVLLSVFLHLPLQVFWRLPGLNHRLNRHLRSELFWRLKCEGEFHLLPETLPSYRYYYLLCSKNAYGRLYHEDRLDRRFKRVRAVYEMIPYPTPSIPLCTPMASSSCCVIGRCSK